MATIAQIKFDDFGRLFWLNRQSDRRVGQSCCTLPELHLAVLPKLREHRKEFVGNHAGVNKATYEFYRDRCKVRAVYEDIRMVGGYVVMDGELLAFHCTERGKGPWLMLHAINDGAQRFDTFADNAAMERLAKGAGFEKVRIVANRVAGGPPVVYWQQAVRDSDDADS